MFILNLVGNRYVVNNCKTIINGDRCRVCVFGINKKKNDNHRDNMLYYVNILLWSFNTFLYILKFFTVYRHFGR